MIEVVLKVKSEIVKETLTRIGIANRKEKIIYPSCYLYENEGKSFIVHFKQLFTLTRNNGYNNLSEEDITRRNAVIFCLKNWGLIEVEDSTIEPHNKFVFVLPFQQKIEWKISHKFNVSVLRDLEGGKDAVS